MPNFSFFRFTAIIKKELLQLLRDRVTFGMIIGIPLIQMTLFGFAINYDPRHMPTALLASDSSEFTRSFISAMENSQYFKIVKTISHESEAERALRVGEVLFVLDIPENFTRDLVKGKNPALRVDADATDSVSVGTALGILPALVESVMEKNSFGQVTQNKPTFEVKVHKLYNPEAITQYNIIPGLMGVILTMTMVLMTGLAITRERERGTMENLLAMPISPLEITLGKIMPYVMIGVLQVTIILLLAHFVFQLPLFGSIVLLYFCAILFILASLSVGIMLSSLAQNQLQAMQMTFFYFLPNILLSGFMAPFAGMPNWAQFLGNILPLTHFNRLVRGIVLKGAGIDELWVNMWPIGIFIVVMMAVAVLFYRKTLD